MQKKFTSYALDELPEGFVYPEKYLSFSESGEYPHIYPWWFVDAQSDAGKLFYLLRKRDGRNLVPFAKVDDGRDDIACFDGDNRTGNPAILMQINDGSGREYSFKDFDDWLSQAQIDASK